MLDRSSASTSTSSWGSNVYGLAQWFHYPYPADIEVTNRWPNLRGESGTDWDHVILIGDPYTVEYTPGLYAQGVRLVGEEVEKGGGNVTLLMPWPATNSLSSVDHYKEVVYRAGRTGGYQVAPAGLAWQADGSQAAVTPDSARGAYICAASIYSRIWGESATNSTYSYDDALADAVHTTVTNNMGVEQYTGTFDTPNPFLMLGDPRRHVYHSQKGTSTELGYSRGVTDAMVRSRVTEGGIGSYSDNNPTAPIWSLTPMPIAFNYGRENTDKGYVLNPDYWQLGFGYTYQGSGGSNDQMIQELIWSDLPLANRMLAEDDSARCVPWHLMYADITRVYPNMVAVPDGTHLNEHVLHAGGTFMYTLYSGRCPLEPIPVGKTESDMGERWICQKVGYETAWRLGRVSSRAPGFKVMPSAATAVTVTPTTTETMTVQFIFPPKNDVTVTISSSDNSAGMVGPQKLVFTPDNYNTPQNVTVTGVVGSPGSAPFDVIYSTSSDDLAYDGLSDSWAYTNVRTPMPVTHVDNGTAPYSTPSNVSVTMNLNASGADAANTTFAGPNHGTLTWIGEDVVYTADTDYIGNDGFAYSSLHGSTLTTGNIDIDMIVGYSAGSVRAEVTDSSATEDGQATGTYTLIREGDTSSSLDVSFTISGTATHLVDYNLSHSSPVTIPAGQSSVNITLTPIDDSVGEQTETASIAVAPGAGYTAISNPATISIADDDNTAPSVFAGTNQSTTLDLFGGNDPGLYYGTITSRDLDTLTPNPETLQITNVAAYTEDTINPSITEVYTGQIYDADGAISFTENTDDYARIWIDGVLVVTSDDKRNRISTPNLNLTPGWHDIEIRIANSSQDSGPFTLPGIGYDPDGGTNWQTLVDPGDGSLLRVGTVPSVTVSLNGTVTDPDDVSATTWTLFSSDPAGQPVTFANPFSSVTTATFVAAGTYVLHLTADDGYGPVLDEVVITVLPPPTYTLTVTGGMGDGEYPAGVTASINAEIPAGYRFINWTTSDGGVIADGNALNTTYTMPAGAAEITANYELNSLPVVNAGPDQTLPFMRNTPWTPAMIDTVAWLDASDSSSITLNNGFVSQWNDKSGNENHATQPTETLRPIYDSTAKNITGGLVRMMSLPTDMYLGKTSGTLCFVGKQVGSRAGWGKLGNNAGGIHTPWDKNHIDSFLGDGKTATTPTSGMYQSKTLQSRVHTGANMQMYSDGNKVLDSASSFNPSTTYAQLFGQYHDYTLYEVIFLPDADVATRQKAEGYLAHKWGLSLPAGHPYANAAPLGAGALASFSNASVTDADNNDTLTKTWSVVSKVPSSTPDPSFNDPTLVNPVATFMESGNYHLRLTVSDRWTSVSDDVLITVEEEVFHSLTVINGTGDGDYPAYTSVTITADAPPSGYRFANWTTSDGGVFADENSSSTIFSMPTGAAEVTANYEPNSLPVVNAGPDQRMPSPISSISLTDARVTDTDSNDTLTVTWSVVSKEPSDAADPTFDDASQVNPIVSFTESGNYVLRLTVNDGWTSVSDDVLITDAPLPTYTLTVNGGTGGGSYVSGTIVPITADPPSAGNRFANWSTSDGGFFADENSASTTYNMPAGNAEVTANYELNSLPVVNAGEDQMVVLALSNVSLGWSHTAWTSDADSGISSDNTYTVAQSFGDNNGSVVVNGVTFNEDYNTSGTGWSISGSKSNWAGDDNGLITGESEKLAQEFIYNGNPRTVTFTGLTVGQYYEVNFFSVAWETGDRIQEFSITGGDNVEINQSFYGNNNGIRINCTYIATAASQQFAITPKGTGSFHFYAMTNHEIISQQGSAILGSSVTDADSNDTLTATWSVVSKVPSDAADPSFSDSSLMNPTVTFTESGSYVLRLTVNDGWTSVSDDVLITVAPVPTYTLTVNGGTGGGSYVSGTIVPITADPPSAGNRFANWSTSDGGFFADENSASTTYNMPAGNAEVTANYAINNLPVVDAGPDQAVFMSPSAPWSLSSITKAAWYDAADDSTITESSGAVSQWDDKSGNAKHLTQVTASEQPRTDSQTLNNLNVLSFDGSDALGINNNWLQGRSSLGMILVVDSTESSVGDRGIAGTNDGTGADDGFGIRFDDAGYRGGENDVFRGVCRTSNGDNAMESSANSATLAPTLLLAEWSAASGGRIRINGSLDTLSYNASSTGSTTTNMTAFFVGAQAKSRLVGNVGEVIVYDGLPDSDIEKIEGYLAHKWGLEGRLDGGHPYKATPPGGTRATVTLNDASVTDPEHSPTYVWTNTGTGTGTGTVVFSDANALNPTVIFTAVGTYVLRLTGSDGLASVSDDVLITVGSLPAKYAVWASGPFANPFIETALTSNPDGDSMGNLMEFAFGTDPTVPDANSLAIDGSSHGLPTLMNSGDESFEFYFIRRKDHGSSGSVSYTPQFSSDLGSFTDNNNGTNPLFKVGDSTLDGDHYEVMKVAFPAGYRFGRVEVELEP